MTTLVLRNGVVIDPSQGIEEEKDLLIRDGVVVDVLRAGEKVSDAKETDCRGMWLVPGLVDLHVHFREPGYEWKETIQTGSEAAVVGGYTSVCCMPNTSPVNDCREITEFILRKAKSSDLCRVHPIGSVSKDLKGKEMAPLSELREAGCVAFSDDGEPVYDSLMMRRALEWCSMLDAVISCHEEDKCLSCGGAMNEGALSSRLGLAGWPTIAEEVMIARDIELARYTKGKIHICHVSTARGVELIRRAKNDGIRVTAEVTPHHLVLTEKNCDGYNTDAKMSPPLRREEDCEALLKGVCDGTIDAIASDHAPHESDKKQCEFSAAAFGILGLQTTLPILLRFVSDKTLSRTRMIEACSSSAAKCFGLQAGSLKKGAPADIVVIDPKKQWRFSKEVVRSLSVNSPFKDWDFMGAAAMTFVGGVLKAQGGEVIS